MSYICFLIGTFVGVVLMCLVYHFRDDYKQGYIDGFKRGKGYDSN